MSIGTKIPTLLDPGIPPLENGDHLTRDEFERRYEAMPLLKKAELIEGVVYIMPPAVRANSHGSPHANLVGCFVFYLSETPGVKVYDNSSTRLDLDNEPQPDVAMLIEPAFGGQARISDDDYIEGAPELVAEVSASTVSIDLNSKFRVYRRNGVREYIVWRIQDRVIDQFVLRGTQYDLVPPSLDGILRSEQFPGFWLDTVALLRADIGAVIRLLNLGLASPEHAAFVATLQSRKAATPPNP